MSDGKEHENVSKQMCYIYEEKVAETMKFLRHFLGSFCLEQHEHSLPNPPLLL